MATSNPRHLSVLSGALVERISFLHKDLSLNQAGPEWVLHPPLSQWNTMSLLLGSGSPAHPSLKLQAGSALPKTTWIEQGGGGGGGVSPQGKLGCYFQQKEESGWAGKNNRCPPQQLFS